MEESDKSNVRWCLQTLKTAKLNASVPTYGIDMGTDDHKMFLVTNTAIGMVDEDGLLIDEDTREVVLFQAINRKNAERKKQKVIDWYKSKKK